MSMIPHKPDCCSSAADTGVSLGNPRRDSADTWARRWGVFASITVLIALVWLLLLPSLASRPTLRRQIDFLDAHEIDPSAMFYTELEATDAALNRVEEFHRRHPLALWIPAGQEDHQSGNRSIDPR